MDAGTAAWLREQPLNVPVVIDGIVVWLKVGPRGAVLGALLEQDCDEQRMRSLAGQGFRCATEFDAGFALADDGVSLCLLQWLPGAAGWADAAPALEKLLNQVDTLRLAGDPVGAATGRNPMQDRTEQRLRKMLEGRTK